LPAKVGARVTRQSPARLQKLDVAGAPIPTDWDDLHAAVHETLAEPAHDPLNARLEGLLERFVTPIQDPADHR
jgi:hypothetical protein